MCQLSHYFLNSISIDIFEMIHWSEEENVYVPVICNNSSLNCLKSTSISHDNPPLLQTLYPILDSLDINTSNLEYKHLNVIFRNCYLKSAVF